MENLLAHERVQSTRRTRGTPITHHQRVRLSLRRQIVGTLRIVGHLGRPLITPIRSRLAHRRATPESRAGIGGTGSPLHSRSRAGSRACIARTAT